MTTETSPLVVHVIYRLDFGGLENGLVNLLNHTSDLNLRHAIICLSGFTDFKKRIKRPDVAVYSVDKKPGKDFGAYLRFWRLLRKLRPAIVHTRNLGTVDLQWVALAAGAPRRIHGEHGWDASDPNGLNAKNLRIRRACRPVIHRYAAVSQDLAKWLRARIGIDAGRVTQIYNGVDTQHFSPDGPIPDDAPWSLPGASGVRPFIFGTVGRLDPIKNQLALVDAFAAVVRAYKSNLPLGLVIAGDGTMATRLRERAGELGIKDNVWFTGARNDIAALMRTFDVFVLPSLNEGISNTILEAMACGRPVVASDVGGNGELIESQRTGVLYPASSEGALEKAMGIYLSDSSLAKVHGGAARIRVCENFSMDAMVSGYSSLYRSVLAGVTDTTVSN